MLRASYAGLPPPLSWSKHANLCHQSDVCGKEKQSLESTRNDLIWPQNREMADDGTSRPVSELKLHSTIIRTFDFMT
jgi:hypothetical protein